MDICSLVIGARPESLQALRRDLQALPGVELHAVADDGRVVVTVETDDHGNSVDVIERMRTLDGVLSVGLVYHHFEPDPEQEAPHGTDPT